MNLHTGKPMDQVVFQCITWFLTQLILTTCQILYTFISDIIVALNSSAPRFLQPCTCSSEHSNPKKGLHAPHSANPLTVRIAMPVLLGPWRTTTVFHHSVGLPLFSSPNAGTHLWTQHAIELQYCLESSCYADGRTSPHFTPSSATWGKGAGQPCIAITRVCTLHFSNFSITSWKHRRFIRGLSLA